MLLWFYFQGYSHFNGGSMTRLIGIAILLGGIWGAISIEAQGQEPRSITLDESIERALDEHGMLERARADADEARAMQRRAQSGWWPSIRGQAHYLRLSDNIPPIETEIPGVGETFPIAPIQRNQYHTEVAIEQPLFTGFRRSGERRAAARRAEAADESVHQQRADVALEVRRAYWKLAQAQHRREAVKTAIEHVDAHLNDVRNRREAGAALESHVLAAETRRSEVRLDRVEAENAVRLARTELNQLIGEPRDRPLRLETEDVGRDELLDLSLDELRTSATDNHPRLNALRGHAAALDAEAGIARRQWMPTIALTGRYLFARPNPYFFVERDEFRGSWEAGLSMRWTLWDGGRRSADAEAARARLRSTEAQLDHTERRIDQSVERHHLAVKGAREAVEVGTQAVRHAEASFEMAKEQFEEGAALSADVLEAESALRSAELRKAEAQANYAIAQAELLYALGRIW